MSENRIQTAAHLAFSALTVLLMGSTTNPDTEQLQTIVESKPERKDSTRALHPHGLYTAVARKLHVTPSHVRNVAVGIRSSKRIKAAIDAELAAKQEASK